MTNEMFMGKYIAISKDETGKSLPEKQWVVVDVPEIVDPLRWYRSQDARTRRKTFHGNDCYLLAGKIIDTDTPQRKKFSGVRRTKGGFSYRRNQCRDINGASYSAFEIPAQPLEDYVWNIVTDALRNPERFYHAYKKRLETQDSTKAVYKNQCKELRKAIQKLEGEEIPRIQSAFEEGLYTIETTKQRLKVKEDLLEQKKISLTHAESHFQENTSLEEEYKKLIYFSEKIAKDLQTYSRDQKRILCDLLVERIELSRVPDPEKPKQWIISGEVILRFGKPLYIHEKSKVRTLAPSLRLPSREISSISCVSGEKGISDSKIQKREGEKKFVFPFRFRKWKDAHPITNRGLWKSAFINMPTVGNNG